MASTRECLLNQFADRSVCANQNNFHKSSILFCLGLVASSDHFVTPSVCQSTNLQQAHFSWLASGFAVWAGGSARLSSHKLRIHLLRRLVSVATRPEP